MSERMSVRMQRAAEILDVSVYTVRALIAQGELDAHRVGGHVKGRICVYLDSLDGYRERCRIVPHSKRAARKLETIRTPPPDKHAYTVALASLKKAGLV